MLIFGQTTTPINFKYEFSQYSMAGIFSLIIFMIIGAYEYYYVGRMDYGVVSRTTADVCAVLISFVFLMGPLTRMFNFADKYLQFRKEIGIIAFIIGMLHVYIELIPLNLLTRLLETWRLSMLSGLIATIIFIIIFVISNEISKKILGAENWWKLQYWGLRILFVFLLMHLLVLKWDDHIIPWLKDGTLSIRDAKFSVAHRELPSPAILISVIMLSVGKIRFAEFVNLNLGKFVSLTMCLLVIVIYMTLFFRGQMF